MKRLASGRLRINIVYRFQQNPLLIKELNPDLLKMKDKRYFFNLVFNISLRKQPETDKPF